MGCFVEPQGGEGFGGAAPQVIVDLVGEVGFRGVDFDGFDAAEARLDDGQFDVGEASGGADDEDEVREVAIEDVVELLHCVVGESFAEEHDVWAEHAVAFGAGERELGGCVAEGLEEFFEFRAM